MANFGPLQDLREFMQRKFSSTNAFVVVYLCKWLNQTSKNLILQVCSQSWFKLLTYDFNFTNGYIG